MIAEHRYNSFSPQRPSQSGQRILKTGVRLDRVPRRNRKLQFSIAMPQIPSPRTRIQKQADHRGAFRPLALPGLRLFAAQRLLDILERIFDTPASGKSADDLCRCQPQVGRNKKVVLFPARWITADDQLDRSGRDLVPNNHFGDDQSISCFSAWLNLKTTQDSSEIAQFPPVPHLSTALHLSFSRPYFPVLSVPFSRYMCNVL